MCAKRSTVFRIEPRHVRLRMRASDKESAIHELLGMLAEAGDIPDRAAAEKVIFDREASMSTGMEDGIAIPHGKTDTVHSLQAVVGVHPQGIDFDAADGSPSHIFVLTLSPASKSGPHIRFLAQISRLLHSPQTREKILAAESEQEVVRLLGMG